MLYTEDILISVVLKRRGGSVKVRECMVLVLVCLLLRDGLTVLSTTL